MSNKENVRVWVLLRKRDGRPIILILEDGTQVLGFARKKDLMKHVGMVNRDEAVAMLKVPFWGKC
jgi:hypothetical protein